MRHVFGRKKIFFAGFGIGFMFGFGVVQVVVAYRRNRGQKEFYKIRQQGNLVSLALCTTKKNAVIIVFQIYARCPHANYISRRTYQHDTQEKMENDRGIRRTKFSST